MGLLRHTDSGDTEMAPPHPCHQPLLDWIDRNTANDSSLSTCPTPFCTKCLEYVPTRTSLVENYELQIPDHVTFDLY